MSSEASKPPEGVASSEHPELKPPPPPPAATPPAAARKQRRRRLGIAGIVLVLSIALIAGVPWVVRQLNTVSTDDAYVNGHVTFVAPRVDSQVVRVLVDDNNRVRKGDLLVELDKALFQAQVNIAQATVDVAQADLTAAQAQVRGLQGQTRSLRYALLHAQEDVDNQIALLKLKVASLSAAKASLTKARFEYDRSQKLLATGAESQEDFNTRQVAFLVAEANVQEAWQAVNQIRASLGQPPQPVDSPDLATVPEHLDQTFSAVKQAQNALIQSASQLGVTVSSFDLTPAEMISEFFKRDPEGNIDRIYAELLKDAPQVKQAETKLAQAKHELDLARLDLSYCNVYAEIDGVVTRRNVNPGNHVVPGENLMAIRSLKEIWVDANFKETQLADLRIGLPVDLDVDMYGSRQRFMGRISGFTMGTGSTLALLPPENATGNFVKVVQRLPVRIELTDYDPDKTPLFVGLSVTAIAHINDAPTGPDAGKVLQPFAPAGHPATQP